MIGSKKVLILTAPFGNGHLQASHALIEEFRKYENVLVEEYDLYSEEFPTLSKTLQKAYLKAYKPIGKDVYRMLYYGANYAIHDSIHAKILKPYLDFGIRSLKNKINSFKPDAIISVFPVTSLYKLEEKEFNIPIYTVITDYYANGLWLYKGARTLIRSEFLQNPSYKRRVTMEEFLCVCVNTDWLLDDLTGL